MSVRFYYYWCSVRRIQNYCHQVSLDSDISFHFFITIDYTMKKILCVILPSDDYWNWEDIMKLEIESISAPRSFIFLWCGSTAGLDFGRQCLQKWGFREGLETFFFRLIINFEIWLKFIEIKFHLICFTPSLKALWRHLLDKNQLEQRFISFIKPGIDRVLTFKAPAAPIGTLSFKSGI